MLNVKGALSGELVWKKDQCIFTSEKAAKNLVYSIGFSTLKCEMIANDVAIYVKQVVRLAKDRLLWQIQLVRKFLERCV